MATPISSVHIRGLFHGALYLPHQIKAGRERVVALFPACRTNGAGVLVGVLRRFEFAKRLFRGAADRIVGDLDALDHAVGSDDERAAMRYALIFNEHPKEIGEIVRGISRHRERDLLDRSGRIMPRLVHMHGVGRDGHDLGSFFFENFIEVGHLTKLRRTDKGEILRIEKENDPRAAQIAEVHSPYFLVLIRFKIKQRRNHVANGERRPRLVIDRIFHAPYDTIPTLTMQSDPDKKPDKKLQKIVVVVGPTASGKTSLAITLATLSNGEVISADSRQVYRGLDVGANKVTKEERRDVPHHLVDIADPQNTYNAADFLKDADEAITDIAACGKLPIVAGGTFFYVDLLLGNRAIAGVPANTALRADLEDLSTEALYEKLVATDPHYARQIDKHNPRRLIRALEIAAECGTMPEVALEKRYDACVIGIDIPREVLKGRIDTRLDETLAKGLVEETKKLLAQDIPESRIKEIGLEYRVVLAHLRGEYDYERMRTLLKQKVWQYAKRQYTWLASMKNVHQISPSEEEKACEIMRDFCGR